MAQRLLRRRRKASETESFQSEKLPKAEVISDEVDLALESFIQCLKCEVLSS